MVVELGAIPYRQLHQLYRRADVYVTPAYTETFAHPLVEAMSSGLPVVASDLPVHREICGDAALYFPRFSAQGLADRVVEMALSLDLSAQLRSLGLARSTVFSWKGHVEELLSLARSLVGAGQRPPLRASLGIAHSVRCLKLNSLGQRLLEGIRNFFDRLLGKFGIHRQRQYLLRSRFRVREGPFAIAEVGVRGLEVRWYGVVNGGLNALVEQERLQIVAIVCSQGVEVIDVARPRHLHGKPYLAAGK